MRRLIRLLPAALLGAGAAVLVSCGSSGAGLIPAQNAGPLLSDFQAVERAAKVGDGNCAATEAAIHTTEHDFQLLPHSVDAGLHARLQEGVSKLRELALELCTQPVAQTTATGESTSTTKTTLPPTSTTGTSTAPTSTTPTTPTTATTPSTTQTSGAEGGTSPGVGGSEGQTGEGAGGSGQEGSAEAKSGGAGAGASGGTGSGGGGQ